MLDDQQERLHARQNLADQEVDRTAELRALLRAKEGFGRSGSQPEMDQ